MTEEKKYTNNHQEDENEIDLMEYAKKLWEKRKLLFKVAGIAAIVGIVIAFTTPKQYTVSVKLAPEMGRNMGSGLSSIASMLGVGGLNMGNDADALGVMLYPDIVSSTPFILDLMDTPVSTIDEEQPDTTLTGYLTEYTKGSLIGNIISLPIKGLVSVLSLILPEKEVEEKPLDPFHLTKKEAKIVKAIRRLIVANVDKKTGVTTVAVTMQDPMVAAILTDTVIGKLKEHITHYRVSKAQDDCLYWEELYEQRKKDYYEKQSRYAEYSDANKNVVLESVKIEAARLKNEMDLSYQVYSNIANQLQMARAKVQEAKPVFAVVEPATVPLSSSGTSRKMIVMTIIFLAVAAVSGWILFGKDFYQKMKNELK